MKSQPKKKRNRKKRAPLTIEERRSKLVLSRHDLPLYGIDYSRQSLWKKIRTGKFPPPDVKFSEQRFGWHPETILNYIESCKPKKAA